MLLIHIICKVTRVYQGNVKYLIVFILILRQLVGLAWSDFDLENRHLILRTSSSKTKREYTVPMNQQVIDSIFTWIVTRPCGQTLCDRI
jgi:integrase